MDRRGPKYVELTYVMNKFIKKLCVSRWTAYILVLKSLFVVKNKAGRFNKDGKEKYSL